MIHLAFCGMGGDALIAMAKWFFLDTCLFVIEIGGTFSSVIVELAIA
jgi:hypothetical protein